MVNREPVDYPLRFSGPVTPFHRPRVRLYIAPPYPITAPSGTSLLERRCKLQVNTIEQRGKQTRS
jgi:hypothetical protein